MLPHIHRIRLYTSLNTLDNIFPGEFLTCRPKFGKPPLSYNVTLTLPDLTDYLALKLRVGREREFFAANGGASAIIRSLSRQKHSFLSFQIREQTCLKAYFWPALKDLQN